MIHRKAIFGIELRRKAYLFGSFVCYEHFLHECSRQALFVLSGRAFSEAFATGRRNGLKGVCVHNPEGESGSRA